MELVRYDQACRAVAEAKTIDEARELTNRAEALRAYARQAKNRQLELDALEIRVRAERRVGEILIDLKSSDKLRPQGVRDHTERGQRLLRLDDLGLDNKISGMSQRLAKLPSSRFDAELKEWRSRAETAERIEAPLQKYRKPSVKGDQERTAVRRNRRPINDGDDLDQYRACDGRRISDWRAGELERIEAIAVRTLHCVDALFANMPVANPDPLETMEMIFGATLAPILNEIWNAPIGQSDAGLDGARIARAREAKAAKYRRRCKNCGTEFIMRRPSGQAMKGLSNEGQFCSRPCAHAHRKRECGT